MNGKGSLTVKNIDYSYKKNHVLNELSFELPLGETAVILGANGSGKSTLLSVIAGARPCRGAAVLYAGHDLLKTPKLRKSLLAYVPQSDPLLPELSVKENLLLWYHKSSNTLEAALSTPALEMLELRPFLKKSVSSLSGGMRKRVSLAAALINSPELLILDEPSAALDLGHKASMREFLEAYHSSGHTLILSSHDEEDLPLANRLFILKGGALYLSDSSLRGKELLDAIQESAHVC